MKKSAFQTKIDPTGSETGRAREWGRLCFKVAPKNIKSVLLYKY